jgi:hypothetical protein
MGNPGLIGDKLRRVRAIFRIPAIAADTRRLLAMQEIGRLRAELPRGRLECHGWSAYSQNDEDGILDEIFRRIGVRHHSFVEIAAGDGLENNTTYLLAQGWHGVWAEADLKRAQKAARRFSAAIAAGQLVLERQMVTIANVNAVAVQAGAEVDLLSLDVNGIDYYLWNALRSVSPRVVVIEYNALFRPPVSWRIPYADDFRWDGRTTYYGASLAALDELGRAKGYGLVTCNLTGINAFFVRRDLLDPFDGPFEAARLYQPARHALQGGFNLGHVRGFGPQQVLPGVSRTETPEPAATGV